jgi:hypothetical protein
MRRAQLTPKKAQKQRVKEALEVLRDLGMPRQQQNKRSALCLLALLNLTPEKRWKGLEAPLMGITLIMDWCRLHYGSWYAPNTRETFRRQSMHQFVQAGIAMYNPDKPDRPVNSPDAVYQIEPTLQEVLRSFAGREYKDRLNRYLEKQKTLATRYARERKMKLVPVRIREGEEICLSSGEHSQLIKMIVEEFAPRFVPGGRLVYVGDTGKKWAYFDETLLASFGVKVDDHGKMPDVVIYSEQRNWLLLVESVTSHGPMDPKRHEELAGLFANTKVALVYVSAFPNRRVMNKFLESISWETEVWVSDSPSHLIHFNGSDFMGPHPRA